MSYWDADAQRWVQGPTAAMGDGGPGQPPPDDGLRRVLIVVFVAVVLCAAAGTGIWALARDTGGGPAAARYLPAPGIATDTATATPDYPDTAFPATTDEPTAAAEPTSDTSSPSSTPGPRNTITTYYAALNSGDYETAWSLGGKNLTTSYSDYVAGFADTRRADVTVLSVQDDTVSVDIDARQRDGSTRTFTGTYTVHDGEITSASVRRTG
ncbi:hypothetical protein [Streptomyces sp. BPTC-684]|uniref:hypothetical protein n=1 Tax=Streptomyces sp. BPTC-684 TaxID=3043734 RepID=UPI0024B17C61|nr:hypothetical protein [Streptomyces sp. BPTC-684]WHM36715.1 hypothetical protein QIY60_06995 [Streptomyces sp. BPTC-684]